MILLLDKLSINWSSAMAQSGTDYDLLIVGGGAAGLMAAIWAGRTRPGAAIAVLDSAARLGAKILVAGGGRCNVTHDAVDERAYAGSTPAAIRKVLRRFDVAQTVAFFAELGVPLKREATGKLFPTSDNAHTVLDALLAAARRAGAELLHPRRVEQVTRTPQGFTAAGAWGQLAAPRLLLATGGKALPKSGSDGHGYRLAQALGHSLTARVFPALVPLTLPRDHFLCALSGLSSDVALTVQAANGKVLAAVEGALLCTHFGVSGPAVLDISRHWLEKQRPPDELQRPADGEVSLLVNWLSGFSGEQVEAALIGLGSGTPGRWLRDLLPERLARALCAAAGVDAAAPGHQLTREARRALLRCLTALPLPITGTRGWHAAETTAGGVPLSELDLATMQSRVCPHLYLCGEICDVDGRIGGYNFQWAWASGYVAGVSVMR
jgi:predicted Rossmann fold flavoprotein